MTTPVYSLRAPRSRRWSPDDLLSFFAAQLEGLCSEVSVLRDLASPEALAAVRPTIKELIRTLSALVGDVSTRNCEECGVSYVPTRNDSRYCSNACRQRAYRRRRES
jgi:hypothetical protein